MSSSDEDLLALLRNGCREKAFKQIVERYKQSLYWHIRRIVVTHEDADDVVQNAFIKVWTGLENFRWEAQLYTWLYRIATNEAINFLNQRRHKYLVPLVNVEKQLMQSLSSDSYFVGDEIQMKLQKAILTLPEKQRIVFNMKYFEDIPYEEMSEILDTSVGALKASYHLATKKIEAYLKQTM